MADFEFGTLSLKIARILVVEEDRGHWTYEVASRTGVNRGSAHRILKQFEGLGWLTNCREPGDKPKTVRVRYELTPRGVSDLRTALAPFQIAAQPLLWWPSCRST